MSLATSAIEAAKTAVKPPTTATSVMAVSELSKSGKNRATRNTPAVTIVAAWMSALTGVGPSIASGSQVWRGNWPDLPTAPVNIPTAIQVTTPEASRPGIATALWMSAISSGFRPWEAKVSTLNTRYSIASRSPKSPMRVMMNAFFARRRGGRLVVPEADQQVGAQPDQLPEHVKLDYVAREHEPDHAGGEEGHVGEVACVARVAVHVANGVDLHHEAHAGHDDQHDRGQGVDQRRDVDDHAADLEPPVGLEEERVRVVDDGHQGPTGKGRSSRLSTAPPGNRRWTGPC